MSSIHNGFRTILFFALQFTCCCLGQSFTATAAPSVPPYEDQYVGPNVTFGTPIVGDYRGKFRPQVHYSPPRHSMNDPNGMFKDDNGTWHLYYQYNPTGNVAGNQHWGHATSKDLYHWTNQPIALSPSEKTIYAFSGSAVIDKNNTSGFFANQSNGVVAIYVCFSVDFWPKPPSQIPIRDRNRGRVISSNS